MKTSQYDAATRKSIKREVRKSDEIQSMLAQGRLERKDLEAKLSERNGEIDNLRKLVQKLIDAGEWDAAWGKLGFKKPE